MRTHSNENDFDLHDNGSEGGTHFHMNNFSRRLVLKQRQRVTRKWPIAIIAQVFANITYQAKMILELNSAPHCKLAAIHRSY